ncbi:hypothetical protein [Stenotrophomonas terrae]|nr:hypothetical protein [Stenotrophomonas terrae]
MAVATLAAQAERDEVSRQGISSTPSTPLSGEPSKRAMDALWNLWERMEAMFPGKWKRDNGLAPATAAGPLTLAGETWALALKGLLPRQLGEGMAACMRMGLEWPPNPAKFRALCLGLPSLAQVEQELRPGQDRSPLSVLVRSLMDLHAFNAADGYQQSRMVAAAYSQALQHVSAGGALPAAVPALVHERPAAPNVSNRESAAAAMARAAQELGFD